MTPANKNHCRRLAEKITALLARGLTADQTVCAYIESTFLAPSLHDLKSILADETHGERDSLIDLLLFPDESFQMALAPLLIEYAFSIADRECVIRYLSKSPRTVTVYFPMLRGSAPLVLTSITTRAIVERLNICWQPDPTLRKVIDNLVPPDRRLVVYIRLRHANPPSNPSGIRLLCRFLEIFAGVTDFFEFFDFMVEWIKRINGGNGYQQLMKEKQLYVEAVRHAIQFEQMRQVNNMETLMLRGVRAPTMGVQQATDQIDKIDRLAIGLYGQTDTLTPACLPFGGSAER